ncbi:MAG: ankyrin repeat domain-containing protein [Acutalibacteraceae bacterium]
MRKTLVRNFEELITKGKIEQLKAVFKKCELNAYGGYNKGNAFHFDIPEELARWLAEQGADINFRDTYGRTPLYHHATMHNADMVKLLIDLGADIHAALQTGETALHAAAMFHSPEIVRILVEAGAEVNAKDIAGDTPLAEGLRCCNNIDIAAMADIAEFLLSHGAEKNEEMKLLVKKIGENFEWFRDRMLLDLINESEAALDQLYKIFDVPPVPPRKIHDGVSPITVTSQNWQEQREELWDLLVPSYGAASTVQGEVIRISGRLSHEIIDNGGCNWDSDFRKMVKAMKNYLRMGNQLDKSEYDELGKLLHAFSGGNGEDEIERLCELSVEWVLKNPDPIRLPPPEYKR